MKAEHIKTIFTTAAVTAAITLAGFWPTFLNGAGDGNAVAPGIKTPKFLSGPVEFSVTLPEGKSYAAGDEPTFNFVAVNTSDQPAAATVEAVMMSTAIPPRLARQPGRQSIVWREPLTVVLGPHETQTVAKQAQAELPGNSKIEVYLHTVPAENPSIAGGSLISMYAFSTATDVQTNR